MARLLTLNGVIPAHLMPFNDDLSVDETALRRHLEDLVSVSGVTAIACNGHAAEVSALTRAERQRSLAIAVEVLRGRARVVAGIYADGTAQAVEYARDAEREGADVLLVFPSVAFMSGAQHRPEMVFAHHASIADASGLPIVVFQYPPRTGFGYSTETLVRLAEIPNVIAVKEWGLDIVAFERNLRVLHAMDRPIAVLTSFSQSLLATLVLGADGILSGHGSVVADLHVALFEAVRAGNLDAGRSVNDLLFPLTKVVYADPLLDMHNRMKEALVLLGRLDRAVVRPPLLRISEEERRRISVSLEAAGLQTVTSLGAV